MVMCSHLLRGMLLSRYFRILSTPQHSKHGTTSQLVRQLRRLPRQWSEFQSISAPTDALQNNPQEGTKFGELQNSLHRAQIAERFKSANIPISDVEEQLLSSLLVPTASDDAVSIAAAPTFNLAAYVNKSPTLQQLIQLGVDLSRIERRKGLAQFVLRLDFDADIKPYLIMLQNNGVVAESFGELITKNPLLFKVSIDDALTRINYLEAKRFTGEQRARILTLNPYWLMFATARIDRRLGHFQSEFRLGGDDVRFLAAKQPRLITYNMEHIRKSTFCIREEMGFDVDELKCLLLSKPRLWMMKSDELIERFAYAHQEMQLSHDMLIQCPEVLTSREFRLRQRHEFLKLLGRAQYDPAKDLYVSPRDLVSGTDYQFARHVAKSDGETYDIFLRTR